MTTAASTVPATTKARAAVVTAGIHPGGLERAADRYLQHPSVHPLALNEDATTRFTTRTW